MLSPTHYMLLPLFFFFDKKMEWGAIGIATRSGGDHKGPNSVKKYLIQNDKKGSSTPPYHIGHDLKALYHMEQYVIPILPKQQTGLNQRIWSTHAPTSKPQD